MENLALTFVLHGRLFDIFLRGLGHLLNYFFFASKLGEVQWFTPIEGNNFLRRQKLLL